jgi:hypothetical protein
MAYTLKQQIAECYRRAEEYRRLSHQSSKSDERQRYFLTTIKLTRLAEHLKKELPGKDRDDLEAQISRRTDLHKTST